MSSKVKLRSSFVSGKKNVETYMKILRNKRGKRLEELKSDKPMLQNDILGTKKKLAEPTRN